MSAAESSRLAQWWPHGASTPDRARPRPLAAARAEWSAAIATRSVRWAQGWLRKIQTNGEPRNVDELLAYARSIERDMPGLAADLRAAAMRHDAATG